MHITYVNVVGTAKVLTALKCNSPKATGRRRDSPRWDSPPLIPIHGTAERSTATPPPPSLRFRSNVLSVSLGFHVIGRLKSRAKTAVVQRGKRASTMYSLTSLLIEIHRNRPLRLINFNLFSLQNTAFDVWIRYYCIQLVVHVENRIYAFRVAEQRQKSENI